MNYDNSTIFQGDGILTPQAMDAEFNFYDCGLNQAIEDLRGRLMEACGTSDPISQVRYIAGTIMSGFEVERETIIPQNTDSGTVRTCYSFEEITRSALKIHDDHMALMLAHAYKILDWHKGYEGISGKAEDSYIIPALNLMQEKDALYDLLDGQIGYSISEGVKVHQEVKEVARMLFDLKHPRE